MRIIKRGCTVTLGSVLYVVSRWEESNAKDKGILRASTPFLRDMSTRFFKGSSDPLLRERLWLRVCADIYSRRYKVHDVLEPLASAASIGSKRLAVELVVGSTNQLWSVSEKLGHGLLL